MKNLHRHKEYTLTISPVLGWGSEVSCPRTLPRENQESLDNDSTTLPLSHAARILSYCLLTLSQTIILDYSKLKEFADENFIFDANGRKFFKRVENNVGKGEIAHKEQFLLFPQCFQKSCSADT